MTKTKSRRKVMVGTTKKSQAQMALDWFLRKDLQVGDGGFRARIM